jgi:hypothetical protein
LELTTLVVLVFLLHPANRNTLHKSALAIFGVVMDF